ncbi:hypothetical protein CLTEP_12740 [Clostridium tepidiprofundi DSM 19306]|uniref:6-hydroxymethylpterin diphosphokinase MptE-like domain-containing protein n=1 Tax=Clostridium tepidiprofundi DSM 19306 TaxID=1121338 RepID=A0A151B4H1_9CLOT|nr:6-hydroxymethylpterin diphosphokinase MptE-like protein [Clostridium tepidiprofundi]KYH34809.1 hypothetical protein CLTEP_12740 [Clostridium tepidiprofundi DSM 19306]
MKDMFGRNIEFIDTKENNLTINVNSILLHSKYYPIKESKVFIDNHIGLVKNKDVIVVYGLGMGYHIIELLNRVDSKCKIKVFDLDEELFKLTSQKEVMKKVLKDTRIELHIGDYKFFQQFARALDRVEDFILHKQSLKVLPSKYDDFKNTINRFQIARIAVDEFKDTMDKNYKLNCNVVHNRIEEFIEQTSLNHKPILLVSAGPSLDMEINNIKLVKGKVIIFAVARVLKNLLKKGIEPDMICIIDPQDVVYYNQIKGYENLDIPLCFLSTANHKAVKSYNGPKYMFYNHKIGNNLVIDTGKSVATAIMSIAIKCGADTIMLVGQDLAFVNNKTHCGDYEGNKIKTKENLYKKVMSVNGEMLNTTDGLLYFKYWIENTICKNKDIRFINCSKGARIKGTYEMELLDAISKYC